MGCNARSPSRRSACQLIRKGFAAPTILDLGFRGGHFRFDLTGPTGRLVIVETSTDLVNWLPIWTSTFAGPLNFNDPQSGVLSKLFTAPAGHDQWIARWTTKLPVFFSVRNSSGPSQ